jgi:Flp pilus assembly protein protease CpaA
VSGTGLGTGLGTELAWGVLFAVLAAATVYDLRSRRVPAWLTGGGIAAGVLLAAWEGPLTLRASLAGAVAGGLVFLPFVLRGWLGAADALLLAAVGAWQGWRTALWAAWWTALVGALLALGVWAWRVWRARRARGDVGRAQGDAGWARSEVGRAQAEGATHGTGSAPTPFAGRGARAEPFPYVPAILVGTALALLFGA